MKKVEIVCRGSMNFHTREGKYSALLIYGDSVKHISKSGGGESPDQYILLGFIDALKMIKEPCNLTLTTPTKLKFSKKGLVAKGKNQDLKNKLIELLREKNCNFTFNFATQQGKSIKNLFKKHLN